MNLTSAKENTLDFHLSQETLTICTTAVIIMKHFVHVRTVSFQVCS